MKLKTIGGIIAILIFGSTVAHSQDQQLDFNITGAGARAEGFGGAFIGVADDATAIAWNPAGLAQLINPEASVVARIVGDSWEGISYETPDFDWNQNQSHFVLNFWSVAYPVDLGDKRAVLAAAYQRQLDFYFFSKEEEIIQDFSLITNNEIKGSADTFTFGIGTRLNRSFYLGAATNIWFGNATLDETWEESFFDGDDIYYVDGSWKTDDSFSGLNFVFGALADLSTAEAEIPLKLGMSLKTPFELSWNYDWKSSDYILFTDGNSGTTLSESDITDSGSESIVIEMPLMLGLGASYMIGENLTLSADYETRAYSSSESRFEGESEGTPLSDTEDDLNQIRLGAEYLLIFDMGVFPIRAGYRTVPTLRANFDSNGKPADQVQGSAMTFGTGLIMERFAIDAAFTISGYEQNDSTETFISKQNMLTLSTIYYF